MADKWEQIVKYLNSPECSHIHKWYSIRDGWGYLTDKTGIRHRISTEDSMDKIKELVKYINGLLWQNT